LQALLNGFLFFQKRSRNIRTIPEVGSGFDLNFNVFEAPTLGIDVKETPIRVGIFRVGCGLQCLKSEYP
jgi:hypothetical protein